jgi:hypothetical protein
VYAEQSAGLRFETESANKLMTGFVTLELALAAFLATHAPNGFLPGLGIFALNALLGFSAWEFIKRNYGRRSDIVDTLFNVSDALGLRQPGTYLSDRPINAEAFGHSWQDLHRRLILGFCLIQALPIFGAL